MGATVKIKGDKALKAKLQKLEKGAQGKLLERGAVSGALLVQNDIKRRAPYLTGNLRRSVHIGGHQDLNPGGQGVINTSGAGVPEPKIGKNKVSVYVGTDVVYAAAHEFGTAHLAPRPYVRPAFDAQKNAAAREMGIAFKILIEKAI